MARRGTFGRYNRAAPSSGIADTIMAIAREMAAARDKNIMDAWTGGGLFEGKPVTDDMILAHWKEKMAGVSKDDPSYDEYQTEYMGLDFNINLSKINVRYAQGKASDQQVAQFYLGWAKKFPKDSQFYRDLQVKAAQFLETAKAKGAAAAKKADEERYNAAQKNLDSKRTVVDVVEQLGGPVRFMAVVDRGKANPTEVIGEVDGKPVTYPQLEALLMKRDPTLRPGTLVPWAGPARSGEGSGTTLTGGITTDWMRGAYRNDHDISLKQVDLATRSGKPSDAKEYATRAANTSSIATQIGIWGVSDPYTQILAERDRVINDPTASGDDKRFALTAAGNKLMALAQSSTMNIDPISRDLIYNEGLSNIGDEKADPAMPSFGENYLGVKPKSAEGAAAVNPDTGETIAVAANQSNFALVSNLKAEKEAYDSAPEMAGGYVRVLGKRVNGVFEFDPTGNGTEIGVVPRSVVDASGALVSGAMIEQENGSAVLVSVVGKPIKVVAKDELGNDIPAVRTNKDGTTSEIKGATVGYVFKYMGAGRSPVTQYMTYDGNGERVFGSTFPMREGSDLTNNADGSTTITLNLASGTPGFSPMLDTVSPVADIAGYSSQYSRTLIGSTVKIAENPSAVAKVVTSNPVYALEFAAQENSSSPTGVASAATKAEGNSILSGAVTPQDADKPIWSLDNNNNLVSRPSAIVPGRNLTDYGQGGNTFAALKAGLDKYRAENALRVSGVQTPTGPARLNPNANPFTGPSAGNPLTISAPTALRLPAIPAAAPVADTAPTSASLVAAREASLIGGDYFAKLAGTAVSPTAPAAVNPTLGGGTPWSMEPKKTKPTGSTLTPVKL
jgi:hypothetical protein